MKYGLLSGAQSAALTTRKEVPSLIPGVNSCPADLYLPCWKHGKPAALDVTVISPLQKLTIQEASVTQGHALSVADGRKRASHQNLPGYWAHLCPPGCEDPWRMEPRSSGKHQVYRPPTRPVAGFAHLWNNHPSVPATCSSTVEGECLYAGHARPCTVPLHWWHCINNDNKNV